MSDEINIRPLEDAGCDFVGKKISKSESRPAYLWFSSWSAAKTCFMPSYVRGIVLGCFRAHARVVLVWFPQHPDHDYRLEAMWSDADILKRRTEIEAK